MGENIRENIGGNIGSNIGYNNQMNGNINFGLNRNIMMPATSLNINLSTPQQLNTSTAQQLNISTAQQLNSGIDLSVIGQSGGSNSIENVTISSDSSAGAAGGGETLIGSNRGLNRY